MPSHTAKPARMIAGALVFMVCAGAPVARAHACGGLFCDSPPANPLAPLPVAQAGENVVFGVEGDPANGNAVVTAHIQILYSGAAAKFSWVVPVAAIPELSTGTDRLFSTLAGLTQPTFKTSYVTDGTCRVDPYRSSVADAGFASGAGGSVGVSGPTGVTVVFQGAVGPYEAAVLQSPDASELEDWLTSNGYYLDPRASQIIDAYVQEGKYFVALKLLNGQDVRSIRPIVLTFHGTDPCVPLRLTAIAALPDMPVTVYVLGRARAVPLAFLELELDELRIDWLQSGSNYAALLREAADEAGGNAFVTEYAGPASIAARGLWTPGQFDPSALRAAPTPPAYVQALVSQGLANDPQTLPLLQTYIPMPPDAIAQGISPLVFYGNLQLYWTQYAFPPFDLAALTDQVVANIIEPRRLAQLMVDGHPYLTRLGTFISPEEMNVDPLFAFNDNLPRVDALHTATIRTLCGDSEFLACNAPVRLELADGRVLWLRAGSAATTCQYLPYASDPAIDKLPATQLVWERGLAGEGTRRIDNAAVIQTAVAVHNAAFVTEGRRFPTERGSGCGCALASGRAPVPLVISGGALALVAFVRRRRHQR